MKFQLQISCRKTLEEKRHFYHVRALREHSEWPARPMRKRPLQRAAAPEDPFLLEELALEERIEIKEEHPNLEFAKKKLMKKVYI